MQSQETFTSSVRCTRVRSSLQIRTLCVAGKDFSTPPFKYTKINSEGTFEILIEFDKLGNITSAYPNIKI